LREVRNQIISVANALSSQSFPEPLRAKIIEEKQEPVAKKSRAHPNPHVPPFPDGNAGMDGASTYQEEQAQSRKTAPLRTQEK
jgi:hypothetical protein